MNALLIYPECPDTFWSFKHALKFLRKRAGSPPIGLLTVAELAPKALESEIFSALLEGAASFHTSQQRAMAAATDNADELAQNLTRVMNRARQDSITTEIMEIVGGAEALRSGK